MSYRHIITFAMIVFFAGASPVLAADMAVNGSFENPDVATNTYDSPAVPGWVGVTFIFDGNGGTVAWYPGGGSVGPQYADLGNKPSRLASQDFTVPAGQGIAAITWDATTAYSSAQTPYVVRLLDGLNNIIRSGDFTAFGNTAYNTWDAASLPMTPYKFGPGNYRIEFFANQTSGSDLFADNVIIDVGPSPVTPEPASLMILLLGGSLLAVKRKRA